MRFVRINFDDLAIVAALIKVAFENYESLTKQEMLVLAALRRSNKKLADADVDEIRDYVASLDDNQIPGLVSNVKGILHEMEFVEIEDADGDEVSAALFPDTNHAGFDVVLTDSRSALSYDVQLKATDSASYVNNWIAEHPDGEIRVTEELAERLGVPSSGLSNKELTCRVEDLVDRLQDDETLWDYVPALLPLSVGLVVWELWRRHRRGEMPLSEFKKAAVRATGLKASKVLLIAALMTVPGVNVVVGAALVAKLIIAAESFIS